MEQKGVLNKRLFLSVLLISIILISITLIAAQEASEVVDPVKDMFTKWKEGDLNKNIAKYLFFVLLAIVIYAIVTKIPFLETAGWYINLPIALIVSFLSTAYIAPEEVYLMLVSYNAMGIILGAIIPFIILVYFSVSMGNTVPGRIISTIIWVGFIGFLIIKLILGYTGDQINSLYFFAYLGVIAVSILFLALQKGIRQWVTNEIMDKSTQQLEKNLEEQQRKRIGEVESFEKE